jgi:hypothetical protein
MGLLLCFVSIRVAILFVLVFKNVDDSVSVKLWCLRLIFFSKLHFLHFFWLAECLEIPIHFWGFLEMAHFLPIFLLLQHILLAPPEQAFVDSTRDLLMLYPDHIANFIVLIGRSSLLFTLSFRRHNFSSFRSNLNASVSVSLMFAFAVNLAAAHEIVS